MGWEEGDEFAIQPDYATNMNGQYEVVDVRYEEIDNLWVVTGIIASPEVVHQIQMDNRRGLVQIYVRHDRSFRILLARIVCVPP